MATKYTEEFERFWKAYPRRTAKGPAFKSWTKNVDETDAFMAKAIINDVEKRTRLKWWPFDTTKIPHAATWVNQQRYLDEGWEEDIKTRGQEKQSHTYTPSPTFVLTPGHGNGHWMSMLNRLGMSYLRKLSGTTDAMCAELLKIKNDVHSELIETVTEEIETAKDTRKAKTEMAFLLAETMLIRFDMLTGRHFKKEIIDMRRKPE